MPWIKLSAYFFLKLKQSKGTHFTLFHNFVMWHKYNFSYNLTWNCFCRVIRHEKFLEKNNIWIEMVKLDWQSKSNIKNELSITIQSIKLYCSPSAPYMLGNKNFKWFSFFQCRHFILRCQENIFLSPSFLILIFHCQFPVHREHEVEYCSHNKGQADRGQ